MRISIIILSFLLLLVVANNQASFAVDAEISTPQTIAREAARQKQLRQDTDRLERQKQLPAIISAFKKRTNQERANRLAYLCYETTLETPFKPIDLAEIALAETGGHGLSGKAVSSRGAVGVWQLMPVRAKSHGYAPAEMKRDDRCAAAAVKELKSKLEMADGNLAVAKRLYCGAGKQARAYDIKIRTYRREILGLMAKIEASSQGAEPSFGADVTRIGKKFAELKAGQRKALITFITAGDQSLAFTERLVSEMAAAGADIIELGVPFSDPMADGPTIQLSSERSLASGTTLEAILASVKNIRQECAVPLLLMGYFNPVFVYGAERFCSDAVAAGVDGVLLVDLPPEEAAGFSRCAAAAGLDFISLLTPTSDLSRIKKVKKIGRGFIYYVSVAGVTGARATVAADIGGMVATIRETASLPVAVGFGISTPEQAGAVAKLADGVVVGSALVKLFEQFSGDELAARVTTAIRALKAGMA